MTTEHHCVATNDADDFEISMALIVVTPSSTIVICCLLRTCWLWVIEGTHMAKRGSQCFVKDQPLDLKPCLYTCEYLLSRRRPLVQRRFPERVLPFHSL